MVRRPDTSKPPSSPATAGPVFVDGSGRRLRRVRLFGAVVLAGVVLYLAMIATAFIGGSDVAMPFLPYGAADAANRPVPTTAPAPDPVQPGPAQPDAPAASDSPSPTEATEATEAADPSPSPTAAPEAAEPAADAPGRSESAPGQTNSPEPPAPPRP
jgi:hypothetical protein